MTHTIYKSWECWLPWQLTFMESFRNSILESDSIMYQHLQSSIIFPLLPFLPWAMVPRIVIIWRSSQGSRAAFRAAGTEGATRGGSEGRPRFVLLILQPPSTNSSKYWVMLQGVKRSEKQAASRLAWRFANTKGWCVARPTITSGSPQSRTLKSAFCQALPSCTLKFYF